MQLGFINTPDTIIAVLPTYELTHLVPVHLFTLYSLRCRLAHRTDKHHSPCLHDTTTTLSTVTFIKSPSIFSGHDVQPEAKSLCLLANISLCELSNGKL